MKYAPVLIPTLNRFEHFTKCIESLSACSWAEYTDVYVALDYPAKESHWEGYNKIKSYLSTCNNMNFKEFHVIERQTNYGVSYTQMHNSNLGSLISYVSSKYDRYIISEDDNVFSPNFLEYIDKGLELYENDESVYAIVGYCHPYPFKFEDNNYFRHQTDFSAWGYGVWTEKRQKAEIEYKNIFKKGTLIYNVMKLILGGYGLNRLYTYFSELLKKQRSFSTDNVYSLYLQLSDKSCIVPTVSKVRNEGWDSSGINCKSNTDKEKAISNRHQLQPIDTYSHFDFKGDGCLFFDKNNRIAAHFSDGRITIQQFTWRLSKLLIKKTIKLICYYLRL